MAPNTRRRNKLIALILLLALIMALLLLLKKCQQNPPPPPTTTQQPASPPSAPTAAPASAPAATQAEELLTPATLTAPANVAAGAPVTVSWTGPDNKGDFVTIVKKDAAEAITADYRETQGGKSLTLTAPVEPGPYELRYITARSRRVLGRAAITIDPVAASVEAPAEVVLGAKFTVTWTGPNNKGDYVTVVPRGAPDATYESYQETSRGQTLTLNAPSTVGEAEVRYVAATGRTVLARRPIKVLAASVSLSAPDQAIAGATIEVTWGGPNNDGDYITIVPKETPDGQYANYTETSKGSPLKLLTPVMTGPAEIRYMTATGHKVLARRAITLNAAKVTLSAPAEARAGAEVSITWIGPSHAGDYITIVKKDTPDGEYAEYTETTKGSPLTVTAPKDPGDAEVRYMTGQGNKVLARVAIRVTAL